MFQHILSTTIGNPQFIGNPITDGDKFQKLLDESRVTKFRAGLISLYQCARFQVDGTDEMIEFPNPKKTFPWTLIFIPNPLQHILCERQYEKDKNTFECFTEIAQTEHLENELLRVELELLEEIPKDREFQAEVSKIKSGQTVLGGPTVDTFEDLAAQEAQEFRAWKWAKEMIKDQGTHLYKIVAVDQPMSKEKLEQDKSLFKCLGYIKRKPTSKKFFTHPFADNSLRFAHDFWKGHMLLKKYNNGDFPTGWGSFTRSQRKKHRINQRKIGRYMRNNPDAATWWGRSEQQMNKWRHRAHNISYKKNEGPKAKYEPVYGEHFWKVRHNVKKPNEFYRKLKDFVGCPSA